MATRQVFTRDANADGFRIVNLPFPESGAEPVRLQDMPGRSACRFATVANDSLSGLAVRDGITPVAGDRVLVKNQTIGSQNGIYIASAGAWLRAGDFDQNAEVTSGLLVFVSEGAANKDTLWALRTDNPIVVGTTALDFVVISSDQTVAVVANTTALAALNATNIHSGAAVWVESQRRPWILAKTSSLPASEDVIIGVAGVRWLDSGFAHWSWGLQHTWNFNAAGNNDNAGTGIGAAALLTAREYYKRTHGILRRADGTDPANAFGIETSLFDTDPLVIADLCHDQSINVFDRINATRTIVASGTVTAVTNFNAEVPGGGQQCVITDTGLVGGFGPHVGRYIRFKTSLGAFRASAFIAETSGPSGALISQPMDNDAPLSGNANEVALVVGDTYDIFTVASIPGLYVTKPGHFIEVDRVNFSNSNGYAQVELAGNASKFWSANFSSLLYSTSGFEGSEFQNCRFGSANGMLINAEFINGGLFDNGGADGSVRFTGKVLIRRHPLLNRVGAIFDDFTSPDFNSQISIRGCAATRTAVRIFGRTYMYFTRIIGDANLGKGVVFDTECRDALLNIAIEFNLTAGSGLNQVELSTGAVALFSDILLTDLLDSNGNRVVGPRGQTVGQIVELANHAGVTLAPGLIVRQNGVSGQTTRAQADTATNARGIAGIALNSAAHTAGVLVAPTGGLWVLFDGAPVAGALAYLSPSAAGLATTTVPPADKRLPLGPVLVVSGTMGKVGWNPAQDFAPAGAMSLDVDDEVQHSVLGATEEVAAEFTADFGLMQAATIRARLTALTQQTGGATGTYRVRVGGTQGAADGVIVTTLTTTQATFPSTPDGATGTPFANPATRSLVKVTAVASLVGERARFKAAQVVFEPA